MFHFRSFLSRIMFLHVLAVLTTAVCIPVVLYWFLSSDVDALQREALQGQAEAVARYLAVGPDGRWSLDLPPSLRDQYSEAYGRYEYAVLDEAGGILFSSRKAGERIFPIDPQATYVSFFEGKYRDHTISGASLRHAITADRYVWVQVAEELSHRDVVIDDVVTNFLFNVTLITVPMLLLLLATDIVIFRRAIQPLLRASDQASRISPARIDVRLSLESIPREIRPLVIAVNEALDRLESGFQRQREFAADAAHELRTPLAILRTRIETLPDKEAAAALCRNVEGMTRVVNQLLDAAEVETVLVDPAEKADLHAVCADVAEFIAPLALAQEKTIELSGTENPVWVWGNSEMIRRAVRNLVENALNHTPKATNIEIVVHGTGIVRVLDQGNGIPADSHGRLFERFWRHERQRSGGAGLGLSIVKRIVEAHGATIAAANRAGGGADFSMHFRLASPPQDVRVEATSGTAN